MVVKSTYFNGYIEKLSGDDTMWDIPQYAKNMQPGRTPQRNAGEELNQNIHNIGSILNLF